MESNDLFYIPLYGDYDEGRFGHHPAYRQLIEWAWEGLDLLDDDEAKPFANLAINREIESFGGITTFGRNSRITFPSRERLVEFLLKWG